MRPARLTSAAVALFTLAACTDTNLTGPGVGGAGGTIVFASDREGSGYDIWAVGGNGRGLRRLTSDGQQNDLAPVLSRDGARVAWEREIVVAGEGVVAVELWVMNADGSDSHAVVSNGSENRTPSWDADDRGLVYASYADGDFDVWRQPLDDEGRASGAPVQLTDSPFADQWPRVSPDGSRIVFQTNRDFDFEIYVMGADGSDQRNLTSSAFDDRFPAWTPDGARVVWSRFDASFDLWEMTADGTGARAVVATPYDELAPSVSPDGRFVAFQSDAGGARTALFVAPMAGGPSRELLGDAGAGGSAQAPWWSAAPPD